MIFPPVATDPFIQYLIEGDILGFIIACYTSPMGELFYAFVLLLIFTPLYLRTRSVGLCAILWLLLGGGFIVTTAIVSPIAVLLTAFGLVGILYSLFSGS